MERRAALELQLHVPDARVRRDGNFSYGVRQISVFRERDIFLDDRAFGALLGDKTDIGCNAVLNPGTIIGRNSVVYPNVCWRGVLPPQHAREEQGGHRCCGAASANNLD